MGGEDRNSPPRLHSRIIWFAIIGGATSIGYLILVAVMVDGIAIRPDLSAGFAYIIMLPMNFFGHKHITYRSKRPPLREALAFMTMHAVTAAICTSVMWLVTVPFGATYWLGSLAIVVVAPLTNLLMMEFWVFATGNSARRE